MTETKNRAPVSVVISTCDRGGAVITPVRSVLANIYPDFELWVIDQSSDDRTERAVEPYRADPRFHYLRTNTRGAASGRNAAFEQSRGQIIVVTDDDCELPTDWIAQAVKGFEVHRRVGMVCGSLVATEYDRTQGYIPEYVLKVSELVKNIRQNNPLNGPAACMALRRETWQAINGFDPALGPGARFNSAEDLDIVVRTLLAGYYVYYSRDFKSIHHGFRDWSHFRTLVHRDWFGLGAVAVKYVKTGKWAVVASILDMWFKIAIVGLLQAIFKEHRLSNGTAVIAFLKGGWSGIGAKINPNTLFYRIMAVLASWPVNEIIPLLDL